MSTHYSGNAKIRNIIMITLCALLFAILLFSSYMIWFNSYSISTVAKIDDNTQIIYGTRYDQHGNRHDYDYNPDDVFDILSQFTYSFSHRASGYSVPAIVLFTENVGVKRSITITDDNLVYSDIIDEDTSCLCYKASGEVFDALYQVTENSR